MALVQNTNVIIPKVYRGITTLNRVENLAFFRSGAIVQSNYYNNLAIGNEGTIRFWNDLARTEPNLSTDSPADVAVPLGNSMGSGLYRAHFLNQGWSVADLTQDVIGIDIMDQIKSRTDAYWSYQLEARCIASFEGILADNIANDASDMVVDVTGTNLQNAASALALTKGRVIDAAMTAGDQFTRFNTIIVDPQVYATIAEDVTNTQVLADGQRASFITGKWMGLNVVVSDQLPIVAAAGALDGDAAEKHLVIVCGPGAMLYGDATNQLIRPVAIDYVEAQGNGHGVETLWERKKYIVHPNGFSFLAAAVTGINATLAQLRTAANWDRTATRRDIPIAFLKVNV
jgi:hypothetical protein